MVQASAQVVSAGDQFDNSRVIPRVHNRKREESIALHRNHYYYALLVLPNWPYLGEKLKYCMC